MINPLAMTERTILVTGASSGIGRDCCVLLSQLGARVILVAQNRDRLQETAERLDGTGHVIECFDLSQGEAIPEWIRDVTARHGPLDGLVHSAGIQSFSPIRVMPASMLSRMLQVNTVSAAMLARGFQQRDCFRPESSIVYIASMAAVLGVPANGAYGASKAAVIALARSIAIELISKKIRVNCVAPGLVETEMVERTRQEMPPELFQGMVDKHPMGIGLPRDVSNAVAFLLSSAARWITGTTLIIDGGLSVP